LEISDNAPYPRTRIGRTYSPPDKSGGGIPTAGRARALLQRACPVPQAERTICSRHFHGYTQGCVRPSFI